MAQFYNNICCFATLPYYRFDENTVGVRPGCAVEPITLATFPPPKPGQQPGYIQLNGMDLDGGIEISFMFRTLQVL